MKKRFLVAVLVCTMLFSGVAQAGELTDLIKSKFGTIAELVKTVSAKFSDLKATDWFADAMSKLVGIGVLNGYEGKLNPQGNVKTDEFVKMTVTAMGNTDIQNGTDYWATNYITKARELGLVKDGEFAQYNRAINREEMARIIVRAANETVVVDMDKVSKAFSDWGTVAFKDDLAKAVMLGVMTGYPDKTVRATASATRAEAATMIVRLLDPNERKIADLSPAPVRRVVVVEGIEFDLDRDISRNNTMTRDKAREFEMIMHKSFKINKEKNTLEGYIPKLPEGYEWLIGLNLHYDPKFKVNQWGTDYLTMGREKELTQGKHFSIPLTGKWSQVTKAYLRAEARKPIGGTGGWTITFYPENRIKEFTFEGVSRWLD